MVSRIEELEKLGWGYAEVAELLEELKATMGSNTLVTTQEPTLEVRICTIIQDIGVPAHLRGYPCVVEAISLTVKDFNLIYEVTKKLYPMVAQNLGKSKKHVERAICNAIEVAWDRGNINTLQRYFGNTVSARKGKPTNSQFISTIANHIKLRKDLE